MHYKQLGNTGLLVSSYALGAPNLGTPLPMMAVTPHFNEAEGTKLINVALDHGINFIDTADLYCKGEAEEILGRAVGKRRKDVVISTKVGLRNDEAVTASGLSRRHIFMSVENSLRRLGTDWIDVYIVHKPDPFTPLEETLQALDDVVRSGKVRYIGYSNWPAWMAAKAVGLQRQHNWAQFRVAQLHYSLTGRELESHDIPFIEDAGIGLMAWSPLANGYLTGKYTKDNPDGDGGRLSRFSFGPFDAARGEAVVDILRDISSRQNVTPAQLALAWVAQRAPVTSALIGVSSIQQLTNNMGAVSVEFSAEDLTRLEEASTPSEAYPNWYNTMMDDPVTRSALNGPKISVKPV